MRKKSGFTLIELMVVIVLISMLATISLPFMMRSRAQAKLTACVTNIKNIATALEAYHTEHNEYPSDGYFKDAKVNKIDQHISSLPVCPSSRQDYVYIKGKAPDGSGMQSDDQYLLYCPKGYNAHKVIFGEDYDYPRYSTMYQAQNEPPKKDK